MARLSVILPALGGLDTVSVALGHWQSQSVRDELELIVLCPVVPDPPDGVRLVDASGLALHEARARGVREATADYVVLAEDHCIPDATWAEAILPHLDDDWDAIGCRLVPGDTRTARSQAAFLIGYGQWMGPLETGPAPVLPGHNVVLRRERLVELGDELEGLLVVGALLVRRLARRRRTAVVAEAAMTHFDATAFPHQLAVFGTVGMSYGAMRTRRLRAPARALLALAFPLVTAAHFRRALVQYRRAGSSNGLRPSCLPPAALFAAVWALGESLGSVLGVRRASRTAGISETKPAAAGSFGPRT
jgi:hypothetical protein